MGAKRFTDLRSWQLGNRLKCAVFDFTDGAPARRDRRFCDDIRDAAASVPANLAEGFGRFDHKEFAQFAKIALGSAEETVSHLIDARDRGYLSEREFQALAELARRTVASVVAFYNYLRNNPTPERRAPRRQGDSAL